ncbi:MULTISPECIES: ABC transporter permease [unclassified Arsukibacterium]|uniref:ABC transporter permease n=1 Tax=unclassified Arsukibacterium TaxID=2635278 RepID=UPI000C975927|nr:MULTISPECIES: ABC transporter permease [unclassified Arsukibacterium]MAA95486.1 sodium ABC transporter permease [Rheinheimera sp.]HAW92728.1 sodium ABC transporter permease [Candidatus Azambacteria bacterium]|tara:strand:+ start:47522 stop:48724 length:1203 start_codon:yes stop_codon:yes gene_type:complete
MWQVYFKELTELLRDKKTLIFVILLPILIFPVLFGIVGLVMATTTSKAMEEQHRYVIINEQQAPQFAEALFYHKNFKKVETTLNSEQELVAAIRNDEFDVALVIPADFASRKAAVQQTEWQLIYNRSSQLDFMYNYFDEMLKTYTEELQRGTLSQLGVDPANLTAILKPVELTRVNTAEQRENIGESMGAILAYALVLLCLSGAMYPAVDMGAGEKERGTLETLLICPVSRTAIVLGKFLTVLTTALMTALITVVSLGVWGGIISAFADLSKVSEALASITIVDLMLMFSLLLPTAAIFAALLLAISIYARTFKEAQNYMSPLTILVIVPLMIAMAPGMELDVTTALIPLTNIALAIKELLKGTADYGLLALIFASTTALAGALIAFCVHWFQQEKVLFR